MAMTIEKGIPLPEGFRRKRGERIYPFRQMDVGDSVAVSKNGHKSWAFLHNAVGKAQKEASIKLTTRIVDDNTKRVWRIE